MSKIMCPACLGSGYNNILTGALCTHCCGVGTVDIAGPDDDSDMFCDMMTGCDKE